MIKKIFQISDIHIPNSEEERPYSKMIERFLTELYAEIKELDKDEYRILLCGDIFQQKIRTSNEAKEMFHNMLNFLNVLGKTIIYAGNHDMLESNTDKKDSISPTFAIKNVYENITYLDKELDYKSGAIVDENVVWALYSIFDKFKSPEIDNLKIEYPDHKIIGLYHGTVTGATNDIGCQMESGIDASMFKHCDCVMAGHIHKFQEIKKNGVPIVYSGSLFQQNCGENITGHGFTIWDLETMKYKLHQVKNDYKTYKFTIESYDDVKNGNERLINY